MAPNSPLFDEARLKALRRLALLDSPVENGFDRLTRLAAQVVDAPTCLVSLVDDRRQFFKSAHGLGGAAGKARETPLTHSFCQHVVISGDPLIVDDALLHPQVCENLAIKELGVKAYLGIPIRSPDGFVLGSFCVIDTQPRVWKAREVERMNEFAQLVETEIALRAELKKKDLASRLHEAVVNGTSYSVIATDHAGMIQIFNAGAERMLGYRAEEVVGKQTVALFHLGREVVARAAELSATLGSKIEPGFEVFAAIPRIQESEERTWTYVRKDGGHLKVVLTATALRDASGQVTGFLAIARDSTARFAAERDAQASRERLASIFHSSVDGIVLQNAAGEIEECNAAAERMLGLTREQMSGRTSLDPRWRTVHEDGSDFPGETHPVVVTLRTGVPMKDVVMGVHRPDGSLVWLLINSQPVIEASGRTGSVVCSFADITERKRLDDVVRSQRERLQLATEIAAIGVWDWDLATGTTVWDEQMHAIYGLSSESETGASVSYETWANTVFPEDLTAQVERLEETIRKGGRSQREFRIRRGSDGACRFVQASEKAIMDASGKTVRVVGVNRDITPKKTAEAALRESEERFRNAFEFSGIGMALVGLDGKWMRVNTSVCDIVGYPEDELLRKTFQELTHPEDLEADLSYVHDLIAGRRRSYQMEKRYFHREGHLVWIRLTASLVRDARGEPVYFISQIEDITERKHLERNLAAARDQALEASRLKSEFLATMSHEIRTPMNGVIGMAGLMIDSPLSAEQQAMARVILNSGESLLSIINDILDFSKIEAGKLRISPDEFSLRAVVEETLALLAPKAHAKRLELTCQFDSALDRLMLGDGGRIRQVLTNLVGNAIKFTDTGEVAVASKLLKQTQESTVFRVVVEDTGVGISPEARARLFEPFSQVDSTATRKFGGTGLGLAICRQLIELMGGEIDFTSTAGQGSVFWFELNLPHGSVERLPRKSGLLDGRRILVVDDNATNRTITLGQLDALGFGAVAVADGGAALERLRAVAGSSDAFELVLLDWHMPGMDGVTLATEIRADPALAQLPLVMLSSSDALTNPAAAVALRFEAFLAKPVRATQLEDCLTKLASKPRKAVQIHSHVPCSGGGTARDAIAAPARGGR